MNTCNTFESPDALTPHDLSAVVHGNEIILTLPPLSVTSVQTKLV